MSRPRFLADHDLRERIVLAVRRREPAIEFVRARDLGLARQPDPVVLATAASLGMLVVSHDVNTMTDHAYARLAGGETMSGLFLVHQSAPLAPVVDSLILVWSASEAEEWEGRVEFLPI